MLDVLAVCINKLISNRCVSIPYDHRTEKNVICKRLMIEVKCMAESYNYSYQNKIFLQDKAFNVSFTAHRSVLLQAVHRIMTSTFVDWTVKKDSKENDDTSFCYYSVSGLAGRGDNSPKLELSLPRCIFRRRKMDVIRS